jgi:hypothetical protein
VTILPQQPSSDPPPEPQRLVGHNPGAAGTFRPHGRRPVPVELPLAFERALTTVLWLVPLVWLAGYFWPPINHDVAALLDVSRRWLAGDRLYVDIIDVNLPLVFVIYALPELCSKAFGGTVPFWFNALCAIAIGGSFVACRRLLHRIPSMAHPLTEAMVPPTLLFLFAVLPNDNFGQREHLMLIACAPYIFEAAARAESVAIGRWFRFGIALFAGIALAQKPYFMAIPLAVEGYLLIRRGWRATLVDLVPWTIGLVAVGHLALIFLGAPAYVTFLLPIIWDSYAVMGGSSWDVVLFGPVLGPTLLALAAFGVLAIFLARTIAARVLIAFALGAAIAAAMQAKGWPYHVLPALSGAILLAALTISQVVDRYLPLDRAQHRLPVAAISASFMILLYFQAALFTPPFQKQRQYEDSIIDVLGHVIKQNAPNRRLLVLSPGIYPHYPVINYTRVRMTMPFQTMWVLQGIYADCEEFPALFNAPEDMSETERFVFDKVPEEFARLTPDLLIVDRVAGVPRCQGKTFDYLEYFQRNPVFARAFERYAPFMDVDRYVIYRRR